MSADRSVGVPATHVWTSPGAPREQDRALVADFPDIAGWCAATGPAERLGLHGRTVTAAVFGEPVEVVEEQDGWARVVLPWQPSSADPRGYPGWIPLPHLAEPVAATDAVAVIRPLLAMLRVRGGGLELSCGTVLPMVERERSEVVVALPDGDHGWLDAADVVVRADAFSAALMPASVVATARGFVGTHYLWGGTSGWGADCSGLVHLAHRVHGVQTPRDAFDQHDGRRPGAAGRRTRRRPAVLRPTGDPGTPRGVGDHRRLGRSADHAARPRGHGPGRGDRAHRGAPRDTRRRGPLPLSRRAVGRVGRWPM